MKIKYFLIIVFLFGFLVSAYNISKFIKGVNIESTTIPISGYQVLDIHCSAFIRDSSYLNMFWQDDSYFVAITEDLCKKINAGVVNPKLFYYKEKNIIFQEGLLIPKAYIYLSVLFTILFPLMGFIVYRKELNNSVSSM